MSSCPAASHNKVPTEGSRFEHIPVQAMQLVVQNENPVESSLISASLVRSGYRRETATFQVFKDRPTA